MREMRGLQEGRKGEPAAAIRDQVIKGQTCRAQDTAATLVVVPIQILRQWTNEVSSRREEQGEEER